MGRAAELLLLTAGALAHMGFACTDEVLIVGFDGPSDDDDGGFAGDAASASTAGCNDEVGPGGAGDGGSGAAGALTREPACPSQEADPDNIDDVDGDGETAAAGDCNDCTALMNRGALDYDGNEIDEDCSGTPDDAVSTCDDALVIDSADPIDGASALGICRQSDGIGWGLVSAAYIRSDGLPLDAPVLHLGHGILRNLGVQVWPREGTAMLALSSGTARRPCDGDFQPVEGFWKDQSPHGAPNGYPKPSVSCAGVTPGLPHDSAGLRLVIKTPTSARSLRFAFDFYSSEFPSFVCSEFSDTFVALLAPVPPSLRDGNICFDAQGGIVGVDTTFMRACNPTSAGGKRFTCPLGPTPLFDTGFQDPLGGGVASGWLQTSAPVSVPGETITLSFLIWDSGDGIADSTVLLDALRFEIGDAEVVTHPIE